MPCYTVDANEDQKRAILEHHLHVTRTLRDLRYVPSDDSDGEACPCVMGYVSCESIYGAKMNWQFWHGTDVPEGRTPQVGYFGCLVKDVMYNVHGEISGDLGRTLIKISQFAFDEFWNGANIIPMRAPSVSPCGETYESSRRKNHIIEFVTAVILIGALLALLKVLYF